MDENTKLIFMMVVPVIKDYVIALAEKEDIKGVNKKLSELHGFENVGAMQLRYGGVKNSYIMLAVCKEDHDLENEFNKIRPYIKDDDWASLLKTLSVIVNLAISCYYIMLKDAGIDSSKYMLSVDKKNTTLYINDFDIRLGVTIIEDSDSVDNVAADNVAADNVDDYNVTADNVAADNMAADNVVDYNVAADNVAYSEMEKE